MMSLSWLVNSFLLLGVKMLLKEILTNVCHVLFHWHFLMPSLHVPSICLIPSLLPSPIPPFPPKSIGIGEMGKILRWGRS